MPENLDLLYFFLTGLGAGAVGGLLGVGGGIVAVPVMSLLLGRPMHFAVAASLFSSALIGASSTLKFMGQDRVRWGWVRFMVMGAILGGLGGVVAASQIPGAGLKKVFGGFLFLVFLDLLRKKAGNTDEGKEAPEPRKSAVWAVGLPMGLGAGLLGIGGGALAVPIQRRVFGIPIKIAIANSSATIPLTCLGAGLLALGRFDVSSREVLMLSLVLGAGGWLGAQVSAALSQRVSGRGLRLFFACFLLIAAVRMVVS